MAFSSLNVRGSGSGRSAWNYPPEPLYSPPPLSSREDLHLYPWTHPQIEFGSGGRTFFGGPFLVWGGCAVSHGGRARGGVFSWEPPLFFFPPKGKFRGLGEFFWGSRARFCGFFQSMVSLPRLPFFLNPMIPLFSSPSAEFFFARPGPIGAAPPHEFSFPVEVPLFRPYAPTPQFTPFFFEKPSRPPFMRHPPPTTAIPDDRRSSSFSL